ncbi:MAG TPA: histidine kinase dimerization/phospho-acceptor domain-containing protein [Opitutaceae bacterium]|nr:histidine kinase dimerization/phospho-acceptor domain-containing protein [Opitutaceae bacterium]
MNAKFPLPDYETAERDRLKARVSELETACRAKDQFISRLNHELRTPLTAIVLWTTLMRAGEVAEDERDEALRILEQSALELQQLVDDLIGLARPAPARQPA